MMLHVPRFPVPRLTDRAALVVLIGVGVCWFIIGIIVGLAIA